MSKNVQISEELFRDLLAYFFNDDTDLHEDIVKALDDKVEKIVRREIFSDYKTATNATEREKFRQEYLDRIGVSKSFRSATETPYSEL